MQLGYMLHVYLYVYQTYSLRQWQITIKHRVHVMVMRMYLTDYRYPLTFMVPLLTPPSPNDQTPPRRALTSNSSVVNGMNVTFSCLCRAQTVNTHTLRWLLLLLAALLPGSRSKENLEFRTLKSTPAENQMRNEHTNMMKIVKTIVASRRTGTLCRYLDLEKKKHNIKRQLITFTLWEQSVRKQLWKLKIWPFMFLYCQYLQGYS